MTRDLTQERLKEVLAYDPETGEFRRIAGTGRWAGRVAGSVSARPGRYVNVKVDGRLYLAHRLAWLHQYGEWPSCSVDHINGDTTDNRAANLRLATVRQNQGNARIRRDNKSGVKGVHRDKWGWRAEITTNGRRVTVGTFKTLDEAKHAYQAAAKKVFGEFARFE